MNTAKPVIVIIGPQGSGKGTQGRALAEKLGVPYLVTGQLLRDEAAAGSERGQYIASIIEKGRIVPSELTNELMKDKILAAANKGVVLDGYPRNVGNADGLDKILPPTHVLLINIPDAEAVKRLAARWQCSRDGKIYNLLTNPPKKDKRCDDCQTKLTHRIDDEPEAIRKRLELYHKETEPILKRYEERGILHHIDGLPSIGEVKESIWRIFSKDAEYAG